MSEIITFPLPGGPNYVIPDIGDENWGQNVTDFLVALPLGVPPTSGTFALTGDLYFGASFGLVSQYFKSHVVNPADSGLLRLSKTDTVDWRNNANSGNNVLAVNGSDLLTYNGTPLSTNSGTVTSVAQTVPAFLSISGSPITTSGTLAIGFSGTALPIANGGTAVTSLGNLTDVGTDGITIGTGTGAVIHNTTISQHVADSTHSGYLSSTDWNTFNSAAGGGISSLTGDVTGTGPGATATTLATVNGNVGSFTAANITVNAKGLITAAANGTASGTVNSGTAGQVAFYATSTNAVSGDNKLTISGTAPLVLSVNNSSGAASLQLIGNGTVTNNLTMTQSGGIFNISNSGTTTYKFTDTTNTVDFLTYTHPSAGLLTSAVVLAMGSNKITGLANGTASTDAAAFGQIGGAGGVNAAGYIIGTIVNTSQFIDTASSTSSGTGFTVTTTTASITPKATTHKIKISVTGTIGDPTGTDNNVITIFRGLAGTNLGGVNGFCSYYNVAGTNQGVPCSMTYLDSPATTSAVAYYVYIKSTVTADAAWNGLSGNAVILLEEIAF